VYSLVLNVSLAQIFCTLAFANDKLLVDETALKLNLGKLCVRQKPEARLGEGAFKFERLAWASLGATWCRSKLLQDSKTVFIG
jgi:hypothetical protein